MTEQMKQALEKAVVEDTGKKKHHHHHHSKDSEKSNS